MLHKECREDRETYVSEVLENVVEVFSFLIVITKFLDSFFSYQVLGNLSP